MSFDKEIFSRIAENARKELDKILKAANDIEDGKAVSLTPLKSTGKLYDIYQRSLPPFINKRVALGIPSEYEGLQAVKVLNAVEKRKRDKQREETGDVVLPTIYYVLIAQDATPDEQGVYFNPRPLLKEDAPIKIEETPWIN